MTQKKPFQRSQKLREITPVNTEQETYRPPSIWQIHDGSVTLKLHPGQQRAWMSNRRFVIVLAGTQGGKTSFAPWWLYQQIQRKGGGDYLAVTSSYDLFKLKFLPVMRETFEGILNIGRYWAGPGIIELRDPVSGEFWADRSDSLMWGRIILRSAVSRGGLESSTAAAAIMDEAGQSNFTRETWEAIIRRLSLYRGRILITTTLYQVSGWLRDIYEMWEKGDQDYHVIQFDSTLNPAFSQEEYDRARRSMQSWRFDLFYRGKFARLPGQLYNLPADQIIADFPIPADWRRYVGVDFGAVNTSLVWIAEDRDNQRYIIYRESLEGDMTTGEHCQKNLAYVQRENEYGRIEIMEDVVMWYGGSPSETQQRRDWQAEGIPVYRPPISDVEAQIDRVASLIKNKRLFFFQSCLDTIHEVQTISRQMDDNGNVFERIQDESKYHHHAALRYICSGLTDPEITTGPSIWQ